MKFKTYRYFVEGPCEKQLIESLNKIEPYLLPPGKVEPFNMIQNIIPKGTIARIKPGTTVVFVFDVDKEKTDTLKINIQHVKEYVASVKLLHLVQVFNFEDEIVKATDVKKAQELTKSSGVNAFKSDFCRKNKAECRNMLNRHHLDMSKLWIKEPPYPFDFVKQDGAAVKQDVK